MSDSAAIVRTLVERLRRRAAEIESIYEWIYPRRSLRFTREGWYFLGVTVAIGLAALNTGHNLFYLVLAMLVSLIVVSGVLSERAVRSLAVERHVPNEIFARTPFATELRVRNRSVVRSSYAVEIHDGLDGDERRRVGFVDRLDPGAERSFVALWTCPRRGRRGFRSIHLKTRFPFGLFEKTRIVPLGQPCLVFPALGPDSGGGGLRGDEGDVLRKSRIGEEVIGLRPKLPDDDPRRIHWRVSARTGSWMVTENADALDRPLVVFFDSRGPEGEGFERAIERTAALVWQARREGRPLELHSWQETFLRCDHAGARAALGFLADVRARPAASEAPMATWRASAARAGGGLLVAATEAPAPRRHVA